MHRAKRALLAGGIACVVVVAASSGAVFATGASFPVAAQPSTPCWDISGTWQTVQGGNRALEFSFSQSGSSVSGTAGDGAGLSGTFNGSVTGDHVDVIVTWNAQRSDGSTLEGEYEATIAQGTLTGSTHDVAKPASTASWTASGGPTKDCGSTASASAPSTTLSDRDAEHALETALAGGDPDQIVISAERLAVNKGDAQTFAVDLRDEFEKLFPSSGSTEVGLNAVGLLQNAGELAADRRADGTFVFPAVNALLPVIGTMLAHAVALAQSDPATAQSYVTAAQRLVALAISDTLQVKH